MQVLACDAAGRRFFQQHVAWWVPAFAAVVLELEGVLTRPVAAPARRLAPEVDLLLCAQASMTRLAPRLEEETGLPVLTSPRLAIEHTRDVLAALRDRTLETA